jgi:hypothetical protein
MKMKKRRGEEGREMPKILDRWCWLAESWWADGDDGEGDELR